MELCKAEVINLINNLDNDSLKKIYFEYKTKLNKKN